MKSVSVFDGAFERLTDHAMHGPVNPILVVRMHTRFGASFSGQNWDVNAEYESGNLEKNVDVDMENDLGESAAICVWSLLYRVRVTAIE